MSDAFIATIGSSALSDAALAGREAAELALSQATSHPPRLAIVFGSAWFNQVSLLSGVRSALGDTPLIGASTAGELLVEGPVSHRCVAVLLSAPVPVCGVGLGEGVDRAPREAGQRAAYLASQQLQGISRAGFLFFGDGLVTTYMEVARGLQEVLGTNSLIIGGMAGDELRFAQTYQYCNERVVSQAVVGALFCEPVKVGVGIEHGFTPISKPRCITRSSANVLFELDRQPAASVYEEYFGAELVGRLRTEGLSRQHIAYPLGIQCGAADQWVLRNVVSFGDDGSLRCSGEMTQGSWLQLMIGSRELALEAAQRAAQQAVRSLNRVALVLVFDSVVRRILLGPHHAAMELQRISQAIGPSVPLAGCYTYGEQAPLDTSASYEETATQTGSVLVVALGT